ncbi:hypothetical protein BJ165DRAFT_1486055 [Panaeolus papilionaceus]|nr:hypothetical protein BJ165DRAFT_1486055 [Panaeolus papilionaceus]
MPVAVEHTYRTSSSASSRTSSDGGGNKLRSATSDETRDHTQALKAIQSIDAYKVEDLDDPINYPFQDQDSVWVRTKEDKWCTGKINGKVIRVGKTRESKEGFYYPVHFGAKSNLRKFFAPMNGEIKPDTEWVRRLLEDAGWIDDQSS